MSVSTELNKKSSKEKALISARFFKTSKGEYGEGDIFIGVTVPECRGIAKSNLDISKKDLIALLKSPIHEYRLTAILIMVLNFEKNKGNEKEQHKIVSEYTETFLKYNAINNWDLVDLSAYKILGEWIYQKPTKRHFQFLNKLAKSKNIWHRRIAIISLYAFVKKGELKEMFKMCELLMKDKHDLINKAVGWMLRECGKKDMKKLKEFLTKNARLMPRVSVRYATEHFKKENRQYF